MARIAAQLAELGNPHRLQTYRLLVKAGLDGLTVGEIQAHLGIPKSTLSHHILHLVSAQLVHQERQGRTLRCFANFDTMEGIISFLVDECCTGVSINPKSAPTVGAGESTLLRRNDHE